MIYLSIYPPGSGANVGIPTNYYVAAVGQKDAVPVDCLSTEVITAYRNGRYSF